MRGLSDGYKPVAATRHLPLLEKMRVPRTPDRDGEEDESEAEATGIIGLCCFRLRCPFVCMQVAVKDGMSNRRRLGSMLFGGIQPSSEMYSSHQRLRRLAAVFHLDFQNPRL